MTATKRVQHYFPEFAKAYPTVRCELHFETPFQLLVAVVLSAQCTDARVNQVTPALFQAYPTAKDLAEAPREAVEKLIYSTGFYRNKAKALQGLSKELVEKYQGQPPPVLEDLVRLPGVGRKTANVVLGNAYGIPGVVVDTHVQRLSRRLGLSNARTPEAMERDLQRCVPQAEWTRWSHWMVQHGRACCRARRPRCDECFLNQSCPREGVST